MSQQDQSEDAILKEKFEDTSSSALSIDGVFANKKVAIGRIFILENNRIEPTEAEKKKTFGYSAEEWDAIPANAREAVQEKFIEEQTARLDDAHKRTIVTYENYLADAEHALIEVRDETRSSQEAELALVQDKGIFTGSQAHKLDGAYGKVQAGASAEVALDEAYEEYMDIFRAMNNPYFQKTLTELEQHRATMQHHLHPDKTPMTLDNIEEGTILVSRSFPLHALSSFRDRETGETMVHGAITDEGSMESHGAILITGMGIPYVRVPHEDIVRMKNDDLAIMDGKKGKILLHPNKAAIEQYERLVGSQQDQNDDLLDKSAKRKAVKTTDDVKINVHANFAVSDEAHGVRKANPVGIGLYRTEIAASMRNNNVKADNWLQIFKNNMAAADPKEKSYAPTTIRTIDLAGDKSDLPKQERADLEAKMTKVQMTALARLQSELSDEGHKSKLKVMVPTISSTEAMREMQTTMDEQAKAQGLPSIKLGCMVEVPSLLTELDKIDTAFMSVGSNDLIHGLLGINRYDSESIKKYDPTNPAVLKALEHVTAVGEQRDIPVSICGNIASDPKYTAMLIGAGYTNLSAKIDSIPTVKEVATRINSDEAQILFDTLMETETRAEREAILVDFNERIGLSPDGHIDMDWIPPENEWRPDGQELS